MSNALDDTALAGGVPSFEQDDDFLARRAHPVLQLDQLALQPEKLLEVAVARLLLVVRPGRDAPRGVAILNLELQLLVVAIDELATEPSHEVFVVNGC